MSHDLRTPLATIRAAAGGLMDPEVTWTDDERRAAARTIDVEADRLNGLVRNLLDMSRIEGGALRPSIEVLDVEELVQPVVERPRRSLDGHEVELRFEPGLPPVRADAVHFDEVLTNLLENAAKYAPLARSESRPSACPDGRVRVRVEDGGPGVPAEAEGRGCSRSSIACHAPARALDAGWGSALGSCGAWPRRWAARLRSAASELGGLAVDVFLRAAPEPPAEPET